MPSLLIIRILFDQETTTELIVVLLTLLNQEPAISIFVRALILLRRALSLLGNLFLVVTFRKEASAAHICICNFRAFLGLMCIRDLPTTIIAAFAPSSGYEGVEFLFLPSTVCILDPHPLQNPKTKQHLPPPLQSQTRALRVLLPPHLLLLRPPGISHHPFILLRNDYASEHRHGALLAKFKPRARLCVVDTEFPAQFRRALERQVNSTLGDHGGGMIQSDVIALEDWMFFCLVAFALGEHLHGLSIWLDSLFATQVLFKDKVGGLLIPLQRLLFDLLAFFLGWLLRFEIRLLFEIIGRSALLLGPVVERHYSAEPIVLFVTSHFAFTIVDRDFLGHDATSLLPSEEKAIVSSLEAMVDRTMGSTGTTLSRSKFLFGFFFGMAGVTSTMDSSSSSTSTGSASVSAGALLNGLSSSSSSKLIGSALLPLDDFRDGVSALGFCFKLVLRLLAFGATSSTSGSGSGSTLLVDFLRLQIRH
ncbi:hypothetical protein KC338_g200 [Hortaea werneckii]|nr:hypothetical protein KC338_g200 [Hortaea werneckii]